MNPPTGTPSLDLRSAWDLERTVIEPPGDNVVPKMYIGSVTATARGSWLVSFSRAEMDPQGNFRPERVYLRRSPDGGVTWQPRQLVYDGSDHGARQAEMGQLAVVPSTNRIYQFSICHTGVRFGRMVFTFSDDDGLTWQGPNGPNTAYDIAVPPYTVAPSGAGCHLMARGIFLSEGGYLLPMAVATDPEDLGTIEAEAVFMISDNLATEPDPTRLRFEFFPGLPHGLRVPLDQQPEHSLAQEPHVVELSDHRLMCTLRTGNGCVYYSVSSDRGRTWREPEPLCYGPGQGRLLHPNAPCPFVKLRDGRFILLHHNHDGRVHGARGVFDFKINRRPMCLAVGRETLDQHQPVSFAPSRELFDSDGVPHSTMQTTETSCYAGIIEDQRGVFLLYGNKWAQLEVVRVPPALLDN